MIRCRSCQAPIEWVKMRSGSPMPVDPLWVVIDPNDTTMGRQVQVVCDDGTTARGRAISTHQVIPADVKGLHAQGYRVGRPSHFATCAHASEHRKPRPSRPRSGR